MRVAKRLTRTNDQVDIDHYIFAPNRRTSSAAIAAKHLRRRPIVHTVPSQPSEKAPLFADIHVTFSRDTAKLLKDWGAEDVRVVPPAVSVPSGARANRARFGIPKDCKAILFAGDMTEPGGAETLAAALERTKDLYGVFAFRDGGSETEDIKARVESRLKSRAIMLGEVDDVASLLRSVDMQCLPASDLTGKLDFPQVVLQSMALGTPVAVGDMAPLNEIGDEPDGVLRISYSPRTLARQIERFLKAEDRRSALVAAARKTVESRFSIAQLGEAYGAIYDELSS